MSGVVLAGGNSRRMGRDKAWIPLRGRPLVERVIERLSPLCEELILVSNKPEAYQELGLRVVSDLIPGKGTLGGIHTALRTAAFDRVFVVACDMPFLNRALLQYMLTLAAEYDVVVPNAKEISNPAAHKRDRPVERPGERPTAKDSSLHPMHAVYSKQCLKPIESQLQAGDLRAIGFYPEVRVRTVTEAEVERFDPRHLSIFNVNTPEDLVLADGLIELQDSNGVPMGTENPDQPGKLGNRVDR